VTLGGSCPARGIFFFSFRLPLLPLSVSLAGLIMFCAQSGVGDY